MKQNLPPVERLIDDGCYQCGKSPAVKFGLCKDCYSGPGGYLDSGQEERDLIAEKSKGEQ